MEIQGNTEVTCSLTSTRAGWAVDAAELAATGEGLLDATPPTAFDQNEWAW